MKLVDLFAGCGGMSLGFQKQGFDIVAAFELWDAAARCYRANFDHPVHQVNLANVDDAASIISAISGIFRAAETSLSAIHKHQRSSRCIYS